MGRMRIALLIGAAVVSMPSGNGQDPFASNIRPTEPLTPEEQLKVFHVPEGFEIQLVAAEPQIQKPMNLAFDARGRLWVTSSVEYPYAAEEGQGRDRVSVLDDTDGDGRFDRTTVFADGLNIPIGLYPYRDGVVVYSIPNIWFLRDTDGDGQCDQREVLYGPLGDPIDTHGLQNSFRRGFDGWLYICHGFKNESTIRGRDGSEITMQSGNTYRVRLDGSRVEQFTWGQVNPFGSTLTPQGDFITADCHSKPLTLLLRGGHSTSFSKPHDGLGFVPSIMDHSHGSTAIAGAAFYDGDGFPEPWRNSLYVGNVMTSRVNRDTLIRHGSSIVAREEEDFVTCDDPWFRPVDLRIGPDGALYIADFYNRIIGHYEVDLDHAGRDRTSGRIWRVVPSASARRAAGVAGDMGDVHSAAVISGRHASLLNRITEEIRKIDEAFTIMSDRGKDQSDELKQRLEKRRAQFMRPLLEQRSALETQLLIRALDRSSHAVRSLATDELTDRIGVDAVDRLRSSIAKMKTGHGVVHVLWALQRLGALNEEVIADAAADEREIVRIHVMRILAEHSDWNRVTKQLVLAGLEDSQPMVRRAATEALKRHRDMDTVVPLLRARRQALPNDVHLRHNTMIALREQLVEPGALERLSTAGYSTDERRMLCQVMLAVPSAEAAEYLVEAIREDIIESKQMADVLQKIATHITTGRIDEFIQLARQHTADDIDSQAELIQLLHQQMRQRGRTDIPRLAAWGRDVVSALIKLGRDDTSTWTSLTQDNPWGLVQHVTSDGSTNVTFLSSRPGDRQAAILRSDVFELPKQLSFELAGYCDFSRRQLFERSWVRLVLDDTQQVVKQEFPPRADQARRVDWDLSDVAGQQGYLELVDGLEQRQNAWLAAGLFDPPVVRLPVVSPGESARRLEAAAAVAGALGLSEFGDDVAEIALALNADLNVRAACVDTLLDFSAWPVGRAMIPVLRDPAASRDLQQSIVSAVVTRNEQAVPELMRTLMRSVSLRLQEAVAEAMCQSAKGADLLLELVEDGTASPILLQRSSVARLLSSLDREGLDDRIAKLTANVSPLSERLTQLVEERREAIEREPGIAVRGYELFVKHCQICHQTAGKGALIGPQLDGIGNRGAERVLEDVLDPNRNVDAAFHVSTVLTTDGLSQSGIFRRQEGQARVFAGKDGKEYSILMEDIEDEVKSATSVMPDNVATLLSEAEFRDLMAYLLSLRVAPVTEPR